MIFLNVLRTILLNVCNVYNGILMETIGISVMVSIGLLLFVHKLVRALDLRSFLCLDLWLLEEISQSEALTCSEALLIHLPTL